jgi:hypothetical protein
MVARIWVEAVNTVVAVTEWVEALVSTAQVRTLRGYLLHLGRLDFSLLIQARIKVLARFSSVVAGFHLIPRLIYTLASA